MRENGGKLFVSAHSIWIICNFSDDLVMIVNHKAECSAGSMGMKLFYHRTLHHRRPRICPSYKITRPVLHADERLGLVEKVFYHVMGA